MNVIETVMTEKEWKKHNKPKLFTEQYLKR